MRVHVHTFLGEHGTSQQASTLKMRTFAGLGYSPSSINARVLLHLFIGKRR